MKIKNAFFYLNNKLGINFMAWFKFLHNFLEIKEVYKNWVVQLIWAKR